MLTRARERALDDARGRFGKATRREVLLRRHRELQERERVAAYDLWQETCYVLRHRPADRSTRARTTPSGK